MQWWKGKDKAPFMANCASRPNRALHSHLQGWEEHFRLETHHLVWPQDPHLE